MPHPFTYHPTRRTEARNPVDCVVTLVIDNIGLFVRSKLQQGVCCLGLAAKDGNVNHLGTGAFSSMGKNLILFRARHLRMLGLMSALLFGLGFHLPGLAALPLTRAHAHNDYEHHRPLLDALDQGFCSVEADIYLVEGQLLVAHDRKDVRAGRTLQSLYLDPLRERFRTNGGHIHSAFATNNAWRIPLSPVAPPVEFTLLIDIKSDGIQTYPVIREVLAGYQELLTCFTQTNTTAGAVTVILSGDRPIRLLAGEPYRLCALDGRISDLASNPPVHLFPLISESWRPTFGEFKNQELSETDRSKLRELVSTTHLQGRRLRFWGAPDQPFAWRELYSEGVDLLNTDNLSGLADMLRSSPPAKSAP